jgi:methylmalonyl-CoA/ethylmalonyl-CoA epimerase
MSDRPNSEPQTPIRIDGVTALEFHHIGLAVENLEASRLNYSRLFGESAVAKTIRIESQKVNVCFVNIGTGSFIELVEPLGEDSMVYKLLKKWVTYYHVGYKVGNIVATVSALESMNYKAMEYFNSEAFEGKRCIFLFSPEAHLIELIEK